MGWTCYGRYLSLLILEIALISCSSAVPAASNPSSSPTPIAKSPDPVATPLSQSLPVTAQVKIADQIIQLEVARTPEQQEIGLMNRKSLPDNRGMLFPFNPPRPVVFWMKNCLMNLDMVFLQNGVVKAIANDVPPCKTEPCPLYGSNVPIDQVIELRGGRAKELGLKVGDRLVVQKL